MLDFITDILPLLATPGENTPFPVICEVVDNEWGTLYLVSVKELPGYFKIGISKDVKQRIKSLGTALVFLTPVLECSVDLPNKLYIPAEKFLHRKFSAKRVKNEWFTLDNGDIQEIERLFGLLVRWQELQLVTRPRKFDFKSRLEKATHQHIQSWQYDTIIDTMRRGLWQRNTTTLCYELGIEDDEAVLKRMPILEQPFAVFGMGSLTLESKLREAMSSVALAYEALSEQLSALEFELKGDLSFEQAQDIVYENSESVGKHAEERGRRLGIDIATNHPLLNG